MNELGEYKELSSTSYETDEEVSELALPNPEVNLRSAELNTEEILHKVVEAAEHNQAIEKLLELRHELKDDPKSLSTKVDSSKLSDVLQKQHPNLMDVNYLPTKSYSNKVSQLIHDQGIYGYAIRYGFVTALLSLLLATLLVLLIK